MSKTEITQTLLSEVLLTKLPREQAIEMYLNYRTNKLSEVLLTKLPQERENSGTL